MRRYYVGATHLDHIPFRIGEGFEASSIAEARTKAYRVLADSGRRYGYLCHICADGSVVLRGTVREDGYWSQYVMVEGEYPSDGEQWNWKPVKKL